ncbi:MAG: prephenate dehydrogenase [Chloroflexi bacterium]|nr:prephenate dehydrogenase [Chloroflexota bacterium]
MPVKVTIIGLGQIGGSIGLSLAAHQDKVFTTGHDKEYGVEQLAKKMGAVNETNHNLPASVEGADLVILALPIHEIRETFRYIAEDLRKDVVIVDTAPVKAEVHKWAQELLPESAYYVGVVPAIGPNYLDLFATGLESAKADLFAKGIFMVSAPPGTPGAAVNLVSDMVELLGSTAVLTDFVESDGLAASTHILPRLVSAALLNATINQPGWMEMQKTASHGYFAATSAFSEDDVQALAALSAQNRENVIRALNAMMTALLDLREDLERQDEPSLRKRLETAQKNRAGWVAERSKADWVRMPGGNVEKPSFMETLFGSKLGKMGRPKDGPSRAGG